MATSINAHMPYEGVTTTTAPLGTNGNKLAQMIVEDNMSSVEEEMARDNLAHQMSFLVP